MMTFTVPQDAGEAEDKLRIRKNALKKSIAEATRLAEGWKNADGSPWTPPPKSGSGGGISADDINANMGTDFMLTDSVGSFDVSGDLLNPGDLRRLADTLDKLFSGEIEIHPEDYVGFDID